MVKRNRAYENSTYNNVNNISYIALKPRRMYLIKGENCAIQVISIGMCENDQQLIFYDAFNNNIHIYQNIDWIATYNNHFSIHNFFSLSKIVKNSLIKNDISMYIRDNMFTIHEIQHIALQYSCNIINHIENKNIVKHLK